MSMAESEFVSCFGAIYEHSPWVAAEVASLSTETDDIKKLAELMADCVDNASKSRQLELIRAHPDLAGKAQVAGELTEESTNEQASAGLDQCSVDEFEQFQSLNVAYHEKFGFPFIMAVKNSSRDEILRAFSDRLENDPALEFETALAEIHKIALLRLRSMEIG